MKNVGEMHAIFKVSTALLLVLILPLLSTVQVLPVTGTVRPGPVLTITISNPQRFTNSSSFDYSPTVVQGMDGTAWVFWQYSNFHGRISNPVISYRNSSAPSLNYDSSKWSAQQVLSSTPLTQNISPSVSQFKNGTMYVSFASNRTGNFNIFLKKYSPGLGWGGDQQATLSTLDQKGDSIIAASDGSVWLFYDRVINPTTTNIYYKVGRGGSWSAETALTTDASSIQNSQPSAYQMNDGSVWLVWTRVDSSTGVGSIYSRVFKSGTWSSQTQLTSTTNHDSHPAIIQDSNTTIWLSWSRELPVGGNSFQSDIFYNYSVNGGTSWAGEINLTNDTSCTTVCPDDLNPNFAQLKDGRVYLFWSTNRDPQMYWNLYYATTNPQPFHNVAVTNLTINSTKLHLNAVLVVNVTVADLGTFPESFFLFITATNVSKTTIAAQYLSLGAGQVISFTINWNTSSTTPAHYKIAANIPALPTEIVTGDNTMTAGRIWLIPFADLNQDGRVDIVDLALVAFSFMATPGSPNWNPAADLNRDGKIDVLDLAIVAFYFGQTS